MRIQCLKDIFNHQPDISKISLKHSCSRNKKTFHWVLDISSICLKTLGLEKHKTTYLQRAVIDSILPDNNMLSTSFAQTPKNRVGLKPTKSRLPWHKYMVLQILLITQRCLFPCLKRFHQDQVWIILGRSFVCCVEPDLEFCLCQVMLVFVLCPCLWTLN